MKITKQTTAPKDRPWKGICRYCQSEAEASESEMIGIQHDQREGGRFCWMKCPACGEGPFGGMLFYPYNLP